MSSEKKRTLYIEEEQRKRQREFDGKREKTGVPPPALQSICEKIKELLPLPPTSDIHGYEDEWWVTFKYGNAQIDGRVCDYI